MTLTAGNPDRFALSKPAIHAPASPPAAIAANCPNLTATIAPLTTAVSAAVAVITASNPRSINCARKYCSGIPTSSKYATSTHRTLSRANPNTGQFGVKYTAAIGATTISINLHACNPGRGGKLAAKTAASTPKQGSHVH